MSQTAVALLIKFVMTFAIAFLSFTSPNQAWGGILAVAILGTIINYLVGDLMVLPVFGNFVASIGDGAMAALTAVVVAAVAERFDLGLTSVLFFGSLVAIGEYFFHRYLLRAKHVAP